MSKKTVNQNVESQESNEYKEKYLRSLADYQNLARRYDEDKQKIRSQANESIILDLLQILHDVEIALSHTKDDGIRKIYEKILKILNNHGLEEIAIEKDVTDFDPDYHEAIETKNGPENKIINVYRKGYLVNNKVIQTALVSVGNGENNDTGAK